MKALPWMDRRLRRAGVQALGISLLTVWLAAAGGCSHRPCYPRPGFAGVPEAINRSPDLALPLSAVDRRELVDFMAAGGVRRQPGSPPVRPEIRQRTEQAYQAVLDRLSAPAPGMDEVVEGSALSALFDPEGPVLVVHDARVGWIGSRLHDLDSDEIRALVKDRFVFAFCRRQLLPISEPGTEARPSGWRLAEVEGEGVPGRTCTGLVVFPRSFALPTRAR
ncbi:MAG: hypothetical protein ACYDC1_20930 [Limisphaerales bacterium]